MSIVDPATYPVLSTVALLSGDAITADSPTTITDGYWGGPDPAIISTNLVAVGTPSGALQTPQEYIDASEQLFNLITAVTGLPITVPNYNGALANTTVTLGPGVYQAASTIIFGANSVINLDAGGNAGARFIFRATTGITFTDNVTINLIGGAQAGNVAWVAGTDISVSGTNVSPLSGIFMASTSITFASAAQVAGRVFTENAAITFTGVSSVTAPVPPVPCYNKGTLVLTEDGYKAVESLEVDDSIQTFGDIVKSVVTLREPSLKKCTFIKKSTVTVPGESTGLVCFKAGSLGEGLPEEDLYVSPNHGMVVGDRLVGAKTLVNGDTIFRDLTKHDIEYFHVEVESHSCLKVSGVLAESFLR